MDGENGYASGTNGLGRLSKDAISLLLTLDKGVSLLVTDRRKAAAEELVGVGYARPRDIEWYGSPYATNYQPTHDGREARRSLLAQQQ